MITNKIIQVLNRIVNDKQFSWIYCFVFNINLSQGSSDNNLDSSGINQDDQNEQADSNDQHIANVSIEFNQKQQPQQHRANTTMHVCWHRNTSVSYLDNHRSLVNQMSGYLLRKFKNSNGWQKLWVVFTNFCLFFYKTYQVWNHFTFIKLKNLLMN